jgi:hypothetical protein
MIARGEMNPIKKYWRAQACAHAWAKALSMPDRKSYSDDLALFAYEDGPKTIPGSLD